MVKRYDLYVDDFDSASMREFDDGPYAEYGEVEKLEAENRHLRAKIAEAEAKDIGEREGWRKDQKENMNIIFDLQGQLNKANAELEALKVDAANQYQSLQGEANERIRLEAELSRLREAVPTDADKAIEMLKCHAQVIAVKPTTENGVNLIAANDHLKQLISALIEHERNEAKKALEAVYLAAWWDGKNGVDTYIRKGGFENFIERKDAERYRYLREEKDDGLPIVAVFDETGYTTYGDAVVIDALVDAAMNKGGSGDAS